jgi:RHS repeat-associated protein
MRQNQHNTPRAATHLQTLAALRALTANATRAGRRTRQWMTQPHLARRVLVWFLCLCILAQPNLTLANSDASAQAAKAASNLRQRQLMLPPTEGLPGADDFNSNAPSPLDPMMTAASVITDAAVSLNQPSLNNGRIEGSLRVFKGNSFSFNSPFQLTGDLYTIGTPTITVNSGATYGGKVIDGGSSTPTGYYVTLNSGLVMPGKIHIHADALPLPSDIPTSVPAPTGTRTVNINTASDVSQIGDWRTVRDLNITPANLVINVPPGNYGTFSVNGTSRLNFTAGTYNFSGTINLNAGSTVQTTGKVTISIAQSLNLNSGFIVPGANTLPGDVLLNVISASVGINNNSQITAQLRAPNASVNFNGTPLVTGQVIAGYLNMNGGKIAGNVSSTPPPDTTAPTLAITSPTNNFTTTDTTIAVSGTVSDPGTSPSGIAQVTVNGTAATINPNGTWSIASVPLNLGPNTITVRATDVAGNVTPQSITVTRQNPPDMTGPTLAITSPANNSSTSSQTVTVNGTVSDPAPYASGVAQVTVNGTIAALNAAAGTWSAANIQLQVGANPINVNAVDVAGNVTTRSINVNRTAPPDTTKPTVSITSPADNSTTSSDTILVTGTADDPGQYASGVASISVNNHPAIYNSTTKTWSIANVSLQLGPNQITATAVDVSGNQGTFTVKVTRIAPPDNTAPVVNISTPVDNFTTQDATITVSGTFSDPGDYPSGVAHVTVNGIEATRDVSAGTWSAAQIPLAVGNNTVTVIATDAAGNTANKSITVKREEVPPPDTQIPSLAVTTPANNAVVFESSININGTAVDEGANASGIARILVNGVEATYNAGNHTWSATGVALVVGDNRIVVVAEDSVTPTPNRNQVELHVTRRIVAAPSLTLTNPTNGAVLSANSITVAGSVSSGASDIPVTVTVNNETATVAGGQFTKVLNLTEGSNTINVVATDSLGQVSQASLTIISDHTPPVIALGSIPSVVQPGQSYLLHADANDNVGLASVDFTIDGQTVATITNAPFDYNFIVPSIFAPDHVITIAVVGHDLAGTTAVDTAQSRVSGPSGCSGYVFDDATGYPLAGVTVQTPGGETVFTNEAGAYSFVSQISTGTVRFVLAGYTPVERSYEAPSGSGTALFDARLTQLDQQANNVTEAGGSASGDAGRLQVMLGANSFPAGTDVRVTNISPQGLVNLLPYGWSPVPGAVVDVRAAAATASGSQSFSTPARLTISQVNGLDSSISLALAHYDEASHTWMVVKTSILAGNNGTLQADLTKAGQYAFLVADTGTTAPPAAVVSKPLPAGPPAQSSALDSADATATSSPRTALISSSARSTINVVATSFSKLPSGVSVEVTFEETYNLLATSTPLLVDRIPQDFVLYAYPSATLAQPTRLGAFFIAKPTKSELTAAQLRTANVHVVIRSGRETTTGSLIGSTGGQVTTSDGITLKVAAGSLQSNTPVFVNSIAPENAGLQLPMGYDLIGVADVDLSSATLSTGADLFMPSVSGDLSRIVVARAVTAGGQRGPKVVARAVEENGRLRSTTRAPLVPANVNLEGIKSGGRYLFIRVPSAFGYANGVVTEGNSTPAPQTRVSADTTPFIDLTGADGKYLLLGSAGASAAGQNQLGAASMTSDSTGSASVSLVAQDTVAQADINIAPAALSVTAIAPADGAANVIATTPVTLTFSKPITPSSLTPSTFRVTTDRGNPVLGTITVLAGNRVASFTPSSKLSGSTAYKVSLGTGVVDLYGKPLSAPFNSTFNTASVIPQSSQLKPEQIRIGYPDGNSFVQVSVPAMSVPVGSVIIAINNNTGATVTVVAGSVNTTLQLAAHVGDEVILTVHQPDGAEYSVSQSAYRRADGMTTVGANGGSVTSDDGALILSVPKGAITGQADLKLTPKGEDSITIPRTGEMDPSNVVFGAGVEIKAEGTFTVEKELHLELAAPAGAREGQRVAFMKQSKAKDDNGQEVDVWESVTSGRVEAGKFKTSSPPFLGLVGFAAVAFTVYCFIPARVRVIYGTVTDLGTHLPVPNVLCLLDQTNSGNYGHVMGRTNQQGRYSFFDFTISSEQFVQIKAVDEVNNRVSFGTAVSPLTIPDMFAQGLTGFITMTTEIFLPSVGGNGTNNPPPTIEMYGQSIPGVPKEEDPINRGFVQIGTPVKVFAQTNRRIATIRGKLNIGGTIEQTLTWKLTSEDTTKPERPQLYETSIQVSSENNYSVTVDGYTLPNVEPTRSRKIFNFIGQRNPNTRPPLDGPPSVISVNPADQAINVDASTSIRVEFSEPVKNLVAGSTIYLEQEGSTERLGGQLLSGGLLIDADSPNISSIAFAPTGGLRGNKKYTLHVITDVVDTTNVKLDQQPAADTPGNQEFTSSFQTFGGTVINDQPVSEDSFRIAIAGQYAYALSPGAARSRINMYDLSNPQAPTLAGFMNIPQRAFAIAVTDSDDEAIKLGGTIYTRLAAVTTYDPLHEEQPANMWLISFDKPEAPVIIGVSSLFLPEDLPSSPLSIRILGGRAYIGNTPYQGVMVVDLYKCVQYFLQAQLNPIVAAVTANQGYGVEARVQTVKYTASRNAPSAAPSIDVLYQNVTTQRDGKTPLGILPVVYAANDIGKQMVSIGFHPNIDNQNGHVGIDGDPDLRIYSMTNTQPPDFGPRLIRVAQNVLLNNKATNLALLVAPNRLWIYKIDDPVSPVAYTPHTLAELGINGNPRYLEIEGTLAYIIVDNNVAVVSFADPDHPRLMTTIQGIGTNPTSIAVKDGFIYSVSPGNGDRDGLNVSIARPASQVFAYGLTPGSEQRCGNPVVLDRQTRVMRQHAGIFFQVFGRNQRPTSQQVIIRKGDTTLTKIPAALLDGTTDRVTIGQADWSSTEAIDRTIPYTAELVLDEGAASEYHSAREPIPFSYLIENYSDAIPVSMSGTSVSDEKVSYGYVIGGNSTIDLTAGTTALVSGQRRPFGLNVELLNPNGLQAGRYPFTLHAVLQSDPSVTDEVSGVLTVTRDGVDLRPPGHTLINGVDLGTGSMGISQPDVPEIKNRGLSLSFMRSYNSGGANTFGSLGYGWGHNYQVLLTYLPGLNMYRISGGDGSGQSFKTQSRTGYATMSAEKPYHGTLVRNSDGSFDYFTTESIRYHFPGALEMSSYDYYERSYMGNLSYMEEPNGNRLQLTYDALGRMLAVTDSAGRSLNFEYEPGASPFASVVSASSAPNVVACVPSNQFNRIINRFVRSQVGQAWRINKVTGPGGLVINYKYDDDSNLIKVTREGADTISTATAAQVWSYAYKPTPETQTSVELKHLLKSVTTPNSQTTNYNYDFAQLGAPISQIVMPEQVTHDFQYTLSSGEIVRASVKDGRGNSTVYNLSHGYLTSSDAPRTAHADFNYNDEGLRTFERDAEGMQTTNIYDAKGHLSSRSMTGGTGAGAVTLTTTAEYNQKFGKPTKVVDANKNQTSYEINSANGNVTQITLPTGSKIQLSYNGQGDLVQRIDERGLKTAYEYDLYGNPTRVERETETGNTVVTVNTYDARSRLLTTTDTLHPTLQNTFDAMDRIIQTLATDPAGIRDSYTTSTSYLPGGQVNSTSTSGGAQRYQADYTYDKLDRAIEVQETTADAGEFTRSMSYDKNSNLLTEKDRRGVTTTYEYDALNFNTKTTVSGTFGPSLVTSVIEPDRIGNATKVTDIYGKPTILSYDGVHRLTGLTLPGDYTEHSTLDANGNPISSEDRNGRVTTARYDALNRPLTSKDAAGRIQTWTYDDATGTVTHTWSPQGLTLTTQTDALGRPVNKQVAFGATSYVTHYTYDGLKVSIKDPRGTISEENFSAFGQVGEVKVAGLNIQKRYSALGTMKSSTDAKGRVSTFTVDSLNRPVAASYPDSFSEAWAYDGAGNLLTHTDRRGVSQVMTYDNIARPLTTRIGNLTVQTITYNDALQNETHLDAKSQPSVYHYDGLHRLVSILNADGKTKSYEYDGVDLRKESDLRGHVAQYEYDDVDRITKIMDRASQVSTIFYNDSNGYTRTIQDRRGNQRTEVSDPLNRLKSVTDGGQPLASYEYDGNNNRTAVLDGLNKRTSYTYDPLNRPTEVNHAGLQTEKFHYDNVGNLTSYEDGFANPVTQTFDGLDHLLTRTDGEGNVTRFKHDGEGLLLEKIEPKGSGDGSSFKTSYTYNGLRSLTNVQDAANGSWALGYDSNQNLTSVQDALQRTTAYGYDALNRMTSVQRPLSVSLTYGYDANGNRNRVVDGKGQTITTTYDNLDRPTVVGYTGGINNSAPLNCQYDYDPEGNLVAARETTTVENQGAVTRQYARTYDARQRMLTETDAFNHTVSYGYDAANNLTSLTDAANKQSIYSYDDANRLQTATLAGNKEVHFTWNPNGLLQKADYGTGMSRLYTYDQANRIKGIVNTLGAGQTQEYDYTYDSNSNRLSETRKFGGQTSRSLTYDYDTLDRLTQVTTTDGNPSNSSTTNVNYTYDAVGNRLTENSTGPNGPGVSRTYTYDELNRLTTLAEVAQPTLTYNYDKNGNLTSMARGGQVAFNYEYDARDQLHRILNGGLQESARYEYDHQRRRINKMVGGAEQRYVYAGSQVVDEYDAGDHLLSRYEQGPGGVLKADLGGAAGENWYFNDALGSVTALSAITTNTNAQGQSVQTAAATASYEYGAWGDVTASSGTSTNSIGYTGQRLDGESGLMALGNGERYYSAGLGRFVQQDSWTGQSNMPQSLNRYAYVNGNPQRYTDPTGHFAFVIPLLIIAAVAVAGYFAYQKAQQTRAKMIERGALESQVPSAFSMTVSEVSGATDFYRGVFGVDPYTAKELSGWSRIGHGTLGAVELIGTIAQVGEFVSVGSKLLRSGSLAAEALSATTQAASATERAVVAGGRAVEASEQGISAAGKLEQLAQGGEGLGNIGKGAGAAISETTEAANIAGKAGQDARAISSSEVNEFSSLDHVHDSVRFGDLNGGAKRVIQQLAQKGEASLGSGIHKDDLVAVSKWFDSEVGVFQSIKSGKLRAVLGARRRIRNPNLAELKFIAHTHPVFETNTGLLGHFMTDIANSTDRVEAVVDWAGKVTHFNKSGVLEAPLESPINDLGYIVGYNR